MFLHYVKDLEKIGRHIPDDELPTDRLSFPKKPRDKELLNDYDYRQQYVYKDQLWYVINEEDMYEKVKINV